VWEGNAVGSIRIDLLESPETDLTVKHQHRGGRWAAAVSRAESTFAPTARMLFSSLLVTTK